MAQINSEYESKPERTRAKTRTKIDPYKIDESQTENNEMDRTTTDFLDDGDGLGEPNVDIMVIVQSKMKRAGDRRQAN